PMGAGLLIVNDVIVYHNQLIACGYFNASGTHNIARWDGSAWEPLGESQGAGLNDSGLVMAVYRDNLVVGGQFTSVAGTSMPHIAKWNGNMWQPLGEGTNGTVLDLVVYNGNLIVGGTFSTAGQLTANNIAKWDGSAWQSMGTGLGDRVDTLCVFHD